MNTLTYNGYTARIEFDTADRIFVGRLCGIDDIVCFHGASVEELEQAFRASVDHYLEVSTRTGRPAQKPYSGKLMLRVSPELHAAVAHQAQTAGTSINQWAGTVLRQATQAR